MEVIEVYQAGSVQVFLEASRDVDIVMKALFDAVESTVCAASILEED